MPKKCSINGVNIILYTVWDVYKVSGIRTRRLRRWERVGIFPKADFFEKMKCPLAPDGIGKRRFYIEDQLKVFCEWINIVRPTHGRVIKESEIKMLHDKWNEVTDIFKKNLHEGGEL
jgi:hypothetical protein